MQASWRLPSLWFLIIIFEVQFDVLMSSSVNLAEPSSEFLHFRDWRPPAGTSLSVRAMKLLYDDGCPVSVIPDTGGQVSIVIYSINSSGPLQNLDFGGVLPRICRTFSQNGPLKTLIFMLPVFAIIFIIIFVAIIITSTHFLRFCICNNSPLKIFIFEVRRG